VQSSRTHGRAARVLIDHSAYANNLSRIRELVPNSKVMAVIKANGYGHGMADAASALAGADEFAVTCLDDVECLRALGVSKPMTLLSCRFTREDLNTCHARSLRPVIYDHSQVSIVEAIDDTAQLDLWLKVDTGMGRLGFSVEDAAAIIDRLEVIKGVNNISAMTHLANADTPEHPGNKKQLDSFASFCKHHSLVDVSVLNSAGTVAFPTHAQDFVRTGLMVYGISPQAGKAAFQLGLTPVMTFVSELISIKRLPAGSSVGYGSTYALDADSRIGVVACGYGDGYPRHAPSGTPVLINGFYAPLIGRVSMDLLVVDLGDMQAQVGDEVILWGADNPVETIAKCAGTIAYELTCGITARVERIKV